MAGRAIYLDHSATTPVDPRVLEAMLPYFTEVYGNSASIHRFGRAAAKALEESRRAVAAILGVPPHGDRVHRLGDQSDNMALRGVPSPSAAPGGGTISSSPRWSTTPS